MEVIVIEDTVITLNQDQDVPALSLDKIHVRTHFGSLQDVEIANKLIAKNVEESKHL